MAFIVSFVSFILKFPPSQVFGKNVDTYSLANITIVIGLTIIIFYFVLLVKQSHLQWVTPFDINIDRNCNGNRAYITIINNETLPLEHISVKIIDFQYNGSSSNDVDNFSKTKEFSDGLKEIGYSIPPNSAPISILIAKGFDFTFTEFFTDDNPHKSALLNT